MVRNHWVVAGYGRVLGGKRKQTSLIRCHGFKRTLQAHGFAAGVSGLTFKLSRIHECVPFFPFWEMKDYYK